MSARGCTWCLPLPPGGRWSPGEFLALSTLMNDRGGRYQISGPNAFYRYGWTDQVPNRLYVYNNRISGDRQIGACGLTLIKVADERLGGVEVVRTPDGIDVVYASKARAWSTRFTIGRGSIAFLEHSTGYVGRWKKTMRSPRISSGYDPIREPGDRRRIGAILEQGVSGSRCSDG